MENNPLIQTFGGSTAPVNPLQQLDATVPRASDSLDRERLSSLSATPDSPYTPLMAQASALLRDRYTALIAHVQPSQRQAVRQAIADVVLSLHPSQNVALWLTETLEAQLLGAGVIEPFMQDPRISEIMVTGSEIFVDDGGRLRHALTLPRHEESIRLAQHLARHCQREYRETQPLMDLTWPENGARINITHHRVAKRGPAITIRKHNLGTLLQLTTLIERRMISTEPADFIVRVMRHKGNVLFVGPTRSGKTTLMRAFIIEAVRPDERLIVLEDTEELFLPHRHQISLIGQARVVTPEEREQGLVSLLDLFRNALRQSPERIIMGELRGPEAFDFIETGLTERGGSVSSFHIREPEYLVTRLYWIAQKSGLSIPADLIFRSTYQALDLIVQVDREEETGFRWVRRVVEPHDDGTVTDLFVGDPHTQTWQRTADPSPKLQRLWEGV